MPRLVVCHLGGGSSVTAVRDGRSVDTTMGLTPLEGRADGDPLRLRRPRAPPLSPAPRPRERRRARARACSTSRGCSVSAGSHLTCTYSRRPRRPGTSEARLALTIYTRRVAQAVAAAAVALDGLDAIVFTAGAGERSPTAPRPDLRAPRLPRRRARRGSESDDERRRRDRRSHVHGARRRRRLSRGSRDRTSGPPDALHRRWVSLQPLRRTTQRGSAPSPIRSSSARRDDATEAIEGGEEP